MTEQRTVAWSKLRIWLCAILVATLVRGAGAQKTTEPQLYFVAIGDVPLDMMEGLVSHFEAKFGVPIRTLPTLAFDRATVDPQRPQIVADELIRAIRRRYATLATDPRTRVIGITPIDMYMAAMREQWAFTFSMRNTDRHFAVVSYARMDPANLGEPPNDELLRSRLRKMITKNIGIMYFGLPAGQDPRSALFGNVLGVDDLDRMTEDFDPNQASLEASSLETTEGSGNYVLTVPGSRLVITIPKGSLSLAEHPVEGAAGSPRYFYLEDKALRLIISGWFESDQGFSGIRRFWADETAEWKSKNMPEAQGVSFVKLGKWDAVLYDLAVPAGRDSNIRAHWVQTGTWIDIHLSISANLPQSERRTKLRDVL